MLNMILEYAVIFLFLAVAIAVHEFSHALVADRLGDPTPRLKGRLTLNPLAHLDPLGTLFMFVFKFGWGKPVPYDPFNLRDPDRDGAKIALAGPVSSFLLAILAAILARTISQPLVADLLATFSALNLYLAAFNLLPIHPLDGFQVVGGFLPEEQRAEWYGLRRYGLLILLFLMFPLFNNRSPLSLVMDPVMSFLLKLLLPVGNIL